KLTGVYREREIDCAVRYYQTMGIAREDRDARNALSARNWQFFDAPHVAFMSMPLSMSPVNSVDVGIYLQSLMLLMVEYGLGSCPQGALAFFPDPVRKIANIPDDMGILCGLSFGYPDEEAVANSLKMPRAPLADSVEFIAD
ncbi:MAG: nitroreductase, partial [Pseudomonadota bacterium]